MNPQTWSAKWLRVLATSRKSFFQGREQKYRVVLTASEAVYTIWRARHPATRIWGWAFSPGYYATSPTIYEWRAWRWEIIEHLRMVDAAGRLRGR